MRLGVRCVSVYAFAIENFKRSQEEVDALMTLAETKLTEISQHGYVTSPYLTIRNLIPFKRAARSTWYPPEHTRAERSASTKCPRGSTQSRGYDA